MAVGNTSLSPANSCEGRGDSADAGWSRETRSYDLPYRTAVNAFFIRVHCD